MMPIILSAQTHHRQHSPFIMGIMGCMLVLLLSCQSVYADESRDKRHSHQQIQAAAVEFVQTQIPDNVTIKEIKAGKIDSRIRFKQCSQELEASSASNRKIAKNWTIHIRCFDSPPWSIYIPVKAKLTQKMLVSKTTITRGEMLTDNNIKLVEQEIRNQHHNYFSDISNVIGREARRSIRPNRTIKSTMLQEALMVHKKETVIIYAKSQQLQVTMKGTALKNGRYNQMIKVRNNSSNKIIDALVIDRGMVAVNF